MKRSALLLMLVIGLICVVLLLVNAKFSSEQTVKPECVTDEDRVNIRRVVLEAVDEAFKEHMRVLFAGWIKDPTNQPHRASAGVQAAIVAYQRARADALHWAPPACSAQGATK